MPDDSNPFRIPGADVLGMMNIGARQGLDGKLRDIQALQKHQGSSALGAAKGAPEGLAEKEKAATQFEALLLHQMLKEMWNTVPKDGGIISGSNEESMYRDMLNEGIANDIAEKHSIGIRDVLVRDMKKFEKK